MELYALLAVSNFINVFLLGFQSKNVQRSRYAAAFLTSCGITMSQFIFIKMSVTGDPLLFMMVSGLAGASGICAAIWVHDNAGKWLRAIKNKAEVTE